MRLKTAKDWVRMLKISIVESPRQCRLVVEGKLIAPWDAELITACRAARAGLDGRRFIADLRGLTAVGRDGERALLVLMAEKVKFRCGVFMKQVLRQLAKNSVSQGSHAD